MYLAVQHLCGEGRLYLLPQAEAAPALPRPLVECHLLPLLLPILYAAYSIQYLCPA